jgi:hypothetical protein
LIFFQEFLDAWKIHFRARDEEVIVHDPVELFRELRDQRSVLHSDHRAAEQLRFQTNLGRSPDHAN